MLFVKKCSFFLQFFSVKIRLEIMFNNVLEWKETFFGHKKFNLSKSQKSHFSKGVNPCFWSKNVVFFLELFSVKIRLEIMFNNVLERKETFFGHKNVIFQSPKHRIFPKGLNHAFGQKMSFFSWVVFGQNKTKNNVK